MIQFIDLESTVITTHSDVYEWIWSRYHLRLVLYNLIPMKVGPESRTEPLWFKKMFIKQLTLVGLLLDIPHLVSSGTSTLRE